MQQLRNAKGRLECRPDDSVVVILYIVFTLRCLLASQRLATCREQCVMVSHYQASTAAFLGVLSASLETEDF